MAENQEVKRETRMLLTVIGIIVVAAAAIAILGFVLMRKPADIIEGQVEGTTVRVSGKLPGRVVEIYVHEGDTVHAGDTLVHIHSSVAEAQMMQARGMQDAAEAQNRLAQAGTRSQVVQSAADMVAQAKAAETIAQKTYDRVAKLYAEGVVTEQKRDEAQAAYEAAKAARSAAESQYSMAVQGARSEEKQSAAALVTVADGGVDQVQAVLDDSYLVAPCDGTIDVIFPQEGELVAMGAPIMNVLRLDGRYIVFNVREELLNDMPEGSEIDVMIPALGQRHAKAKIYYIRDMGSYAVWHSTKSTGSWDSRTFELKARPTEDIPNLRPGMSVVLEK